MNNLVFACSVKLLNDYLYSVDIFELICFCWNEISFTKACIYLYNEDGFHSNFHIEDISMYYRKNIAHFSHTSIWIKWQSLNWYKWPRILNKFVSLLYLKIAFVSIDYIEAQFLCTQVMLIIYKQYAHVQSH